MCGRFVLLSGEENSEIEKILKEMNGVKLGDIRPTDLVPVVTRQNNQEVYKLLKWGFPSNNGLLINARGETLEEKVTFKNLLKSKRCIIPASGFYEWKSIGKNKHKYLIKLQDKAFFYMAGLYNTFIDLQGKPFSSFVIITTEANDQMSPIHHRMPAIFSKSEEIEQWSNNSSYDFNLLKSLIRPYEERLFIQGEDINLFEVY